jgi:hypothetical protein
VAFPGQTRRTRVTLLLLGTKSLLMLM